MSTILSQLLEELRAGSLRVVDLTSPLGPETPVIDLPPKSLESSSDISLLRV